MLNSLVLELQSTTDCTLPASLGRAGHGLFLRLLQQRNPKLATALHDDKGTTPFTASNLVMGKRKKGEMKVSSGEKGWFRFTGLTDPLNNYLIDLAKNPPSTVELGDVPLKVSTTYSQNNSHRWANQVSYQDLAAPYLLGSLNKVSKYITLQFCSPTTFRKGKKYVPYPLPEMVFGSLLNRWQSFAPIALNPEIRQYAAECLVTKRYDLKTNVVTYKTRGTQVGFTGTVTFMALNYDAYWLNTLHLLAAFSFYSGVGYQTGAGLGQTRVINN